MFNNISPKYMLELAKVMLVRVTFVVAVGIVIVIVMIIIIVIVIAVVIVFSNCQIIIEIFLSKIINSTFNKLNQYIANNACQIRQGKT